MSGRLTTVAWIFLTLGVLSPGAGTAQQTTAAVDELKRVVEEKERELRDAEVALAVARARLAQAEGKPKTAADEWRKVLGHYEGRLKAVRGEIARGLLCTDGPLRQAEGMVAVARAGLAEAEGRKDDLAAELPKVIAYHEWQIEWYQALRKFKAIPDEVAEAALKEAEVELRAARARLAALRREPAERSKPGKGDKP